MNNNNNYYYYNNTVCMERTGNTLMMSDKQKNHDIAVRQSQLLIYLYQSLYLCKCTILRLSQYRFTFKLNFLEITTEQS
jgi:hypothetical protein